MRDGFIRVAAVTPDVKVADCIFNTEQICMRMDEACGHGAKILVFPEMCITGYTCEDLFRQDLLLKEAQNSLREIIFHSRGKDALIFVGLPWEQEGKLYNVAAAVSGGSLLGLVPKKCIPMYSEFYEGRYFSPGNEEVIWTEFDGKPVPFGSSQLFVCREMEGLKVAAEICEDIWSPKPPSISHAMAGATVIVNLSASNENTGKSIYRESLVTGQSARLVCGYIYTSAGEGESSTDLVFSAHNMIAENGTLLAQSARFKNEMVYSDLDIFRLLSERRRMSTFTSAENADYQKNAFHLETEEMKLERFFDPAPFVPGVKEDRDRRDRKSVV